MSPHVVSRANTDVNRLRHEAQVVSNDFFPIAILLNVVLFFILALTWFIPDAARSSATQPFRLLKRKGAHEGGLRNLLLQQRVSDIEKAARHLQKIGVTADGSRSNTAQTGGAIRFPDVAKLSAGENILLGGIDQVSNVFAQIDARMLALSDQSQASANHTQASRLEWNTLCSHMRMAWEQDSRVADLTCRLKADVKTLIDGLKEALGLELTIGGHSNPFTSSRPSPTPLCPQPKPHLTSKGT